MSDDERTRFCCLVAKHVDARDEARALVDLAIALLEAGGRQGGADELRRRAHWLNGEAPSDE